MRRLILALAVAGAMLLSASGAAAKQLSAPKAHSGRSTLTLRLLWVQHVSPNADSTPAYISRPGSGKSVALLYVLAGNNGSNCNPGNPVRRVTLYAMSVTSGRVVWSHATTGPSRCTTAGPVADPSRRWVYATGLDGKVHRYDALTGKETVSGGWPVTYTLMPDVEKASATLTISGGHLYVTTSGFIGDQGHYQGHLVTIDVAHGSSQVFNTLCSNVHALLGPNPSQSSYCAAERSGLFGPGQGVVDPVTHAVYVVSGNGPWNGRTDWGDSVLKLNASGTKLLDSFTPTNQQQLADSDEDLGSTGPAILPPVTRSGRAYHLLVQGGKGPACSSCSGVAVRLLNRDNLSGRGGKGNLGGDLADTQAPGGCEILTAPAVWKAGSGAIWVFYANSCGLAGYRLGGSGTHFSLVRGWSSSSGGTTSIVSGGALYVASAGHVTAYAPATGKVLWRTSDIGDIHWEYPRVAGHRLFITDQSGRVFAYAISG